MLVAYHHGGLRDVTSHFRDRIERASKSAEVCKALSEASPLVGMHCPLEGTAALPSVFSYEGSPSQKRASLLALRILHSCLIDADWLDTEAHGTPEHIQIRAQAPGQITELCAVFQRNVEEFKDRAPRNEINRWRARIYEEVVENAVQSPGFFSLSVPTGGGKTLASMGFALHHAVAHQKRRIIVAIPYTSIIDQNVKVYEEFLPEGSVLEHHSNVSSFLDETTQGHRKERWRRLAAQNWESPVVVTTNVQFFESLFASRNSSLRKLHNIVNSVIILDEVQSLPAGLLEVTLERLNTLVQAFGCTVVFSTATQPAFSKDSYQDERMAESRIVEILPEVVTPLVTPDAKMASCFKRVRYTLSEHPMDWETLAGKLAQSSSSQLVILNTIGDAHAVLDALRDRLDEKQFMQDCMHLSTRMCPAHRRHVLEEAKRRLHHGKRCLLISTQVVEAGVDLDFPKVWRAMGPLDAIVQAAGRCNREGRLEEGEVVVFEASEGGVPPGTYKVARDYTRRFIKDLSSLEQLHNPALFCSYFQRLYDRVDLDARDLLKKERDLKFETVSRDYKLIEDDSFSVAILWAEYFRLPSEKVKQALGVLGQGGGGVKGALRVMQQVSVNLRRQHLEEYLAQGLCEPLCEALDLYAWKGVYDPLYGLRDKFAGDAFLF